MIKLLPYSFFINGEQLDIAIVRIDQSLPGTMSIVTTNPGTVKVGDILEMYVGDSKYYLAVTAVTRDQLIVEDLLLHNKELYFDVNSFTEFINDLNQLMLYPEQSDIPPFINFTMFPGKLLEQLVRCNSFGIYLTALNGYLEIMPCREINPKPTMTTIQSSWDIC